MIDKETIQKNLDEIKDVIKNIVNEVVEDELDLHKINLENLDYNIMRIAGEIATAYTLLGQAHRDEKLADIALKKAEANIYIGLINKAGDQKLTVETLKRETLLDRRLIDFQKAAGEALCRRVTLEGVVESLKTKREIIKSLSIKQHEINKSGDY